MSCSITISVSLAVEREQEVGEELALAAREPRARLVEHHHLRLGGERDRERDLALLAVRERADELGELVVDRDAAGRLTRALAHLGVALRVTTGRRCPPRTPTIER